MGAQKHERQEGFQATHTASHLYEKLTHPKQVIYTGGETGSTYFEQFIIPFVFAVNEL